MFGSLNVGSPWVKFSRTIIKVFARLFQKAAGSRASRPCRAPQSAKSSFGVFFLIAFSFAPVYAKEKAKRHISFVLAVEGTLALIVGRELTDLRSKRGRRRRDRVRLAAAV